MQIFYLWVSEVAIIVSTAVLHHHSSSLQHRSHSFRLLSSPHCDGAYFNQPDPGSTWSQLNALHTLKAQHTQNTLKPLYLIKCVVAAAAASYL